MAKASFSNYAGVSPVPFVAGGTIIKDTFVKLDTTEGQVVQATQAQDPAHRLRVLEPERHGVTGPQAGPGVDSAMRHESSRRSPCSARGRSR